MVQQPEPCREKKLRLQQLDSNPARHRELCSGNSRETGQDGGKLRGTHSGTGTCHRLEAADRRETSQTHRISLWIDLLFGSS